MQLPHQLVLNVVYSAKLYVLMYVTARGSVLLLALYFIQVKHWTINE